MEELISGSLSTAQLLHLSWRLFRSHLGTFISLMLIPVAALVLGALLVSFFLVPVSDGMPLREVWQATPTLDKFGVVLLFLASIALFYRVLGATTWATAEFHKGGNPGVSEAFRHPTGRQARLFWLLFFITLFSWGPLFFIPLLAGFAFAPAFPVAALENLGVIKAIQRGDALNKGHQGRIALLYVLSILPVLLGIFALISLVLFLQNTFGNRWFLRPLFPLGFLIVLLIPQFYMVALTLNYFDMRARRGEWPSRRELSVPVRAGEYPSL